MRSFVIYLIFVTLSFNAYGMEPEKENFHQKNHPLSKLREEALQTLNILQEGLILSQTTIKTLQEVEQKICTPEGYGMVSKKSTKEILEQDIPSLDVLNTYTMETLEIIEHIQGNARKMCPPEDFTKLSPESQAEQITLLKLFLNVPSQEVPLIQQRMVDIKSAIDKHTKEIKKKQDSGLKHHNGPLELDKKTEEFYKTELENYRKIANLFISNHLKKEDPKPLKPGLFNDYTLIDGHKQIDHRLVDNLFNKTEEILKCFRDHDLFFKLSLLFFYSNDPDRDKKALRLCASAICWNFQKNMMYDYTAIKIYMKLLTTYPNEKANRCTTARSLIELILKPKEEIKCDKKKKIKKKNILQAKNSFLYYCESLFSALSSPNKFLKNKYAYALYHSINFLTEKSNYSRAYFMGELSTKLYNTYGQEKLPAFINIHYAHQLARKNHYNEAMEIYKSLLIDFKSSNCDLHIPDIYFSMANIYIAMFEYPQALQSFDFAFKLSGKMMDDQSTQDLWTYACVALLCDPSNEEAFKIMKNIVEKPTHVKKSEGLEPYVVEETYQCVLEKVGKLDELTELLLKKQEKILAKRLDIEKKQANAVKKFQAENKEYYQQHQNTTNNTNNISSKKPRTLNTTARTSTTTSSASLFLDVSSQKEKYVVPEIKEKKKTRPETSPTQQVIKEALSLNQIENTHHIYIEDLTQNKNARETFNKLFTFHQKKDCFNNEVKISLHEINSLFYALNQKVDSSQGKGSHTKVTLNLQEAGSVMEEQMIILTKTTYLKDYQIKQIREKFVKAGVVPNDSTVIVRLKADGLLD